MGSSTEKYGLDDSIYVGVGLILFSLLFQKLDEKILG